MIDLKSVSHEDLLAELTRRREEDLPAAIAFGKLMAERIVKNIDALLELVPRHSKVACGDLLPLFIHDGCTRCTLLEIKRTGVSDWEVGTVTLKPLYRDGSALVVGAFPQVEAKLATVPKPAFPVCECGHIKGRHHGDLGLNKCLLEGCKCTGFIETKEKVYS